MPPWTSVAPSRLCCAPDPGVHDLVIRVGRVRSHRVPSPRDDDDLDVVVGERGQALPRQGTDNHGVVTTACDQQRDSRVEVVTEALCPLLGRIGL